MPGSGGGSGGCPGPANLCAAFATVPTSSTDKTKKRIAIFIVFFLQVSLFKKSASNLAIRVQENLRCATTITGRWRNVALRALARLMPTNFVLLTFPPELLLQIVESNNFTRCLVQYLSYLSHFRTIAASVSVVPFWNSSMDEFFFTLKYCRRIVHAVACAFP